MVHRIENGVLEDARSLTVGQEDRKFSNSMKLRRAHRRQILSSDRENIGSRIHLSLFIFASQKSPKTYESSRSSLGGLATGGTEGAEWSTFISGGYDFHLGHLSVGPIDALQYTYVNTNGFSEKSSLAPLAVHSGSAESLRSDFGFRAFYHPNSPSTELKPGEKYTSTTIYCFSTKWLRPDRFRLAAADLPY
jgi:hypothetical protein